MVPCGKRPQYTRVCGNVSLFWMQNIHSKERHVVTLVTVLCGHRDLSLVFHVLASISPPMLMSAENYTLFIKNSVTFPLFGVTR